MCSSDLGNGISLIIFVNILGGLPNRLMQAVDSFRAGTLGVVQLVLIAAIMVAVFVVFVTLRLVIIRELGLGLAVAVLVDSTIIRSLLLPATMRLLGDWNWWMSRFLDWVPRITIEGTPEDQEPEPEAG